MHDPEETETSERDDARRSVAFSKHAPRFDPRRLLATLTEAEVLVVLVGDVAARLHGSPTLTQDLDLDDVIAVKEAADRPKDRADLVRLRLLHDELRGSGGD